MKTSTRFRLIVTICAVTLFAGAFSFISVSTHAEGAAEKARKAAEGAVAKAVAARKCREAEEAVREAEADVAAAKKEEKEAKAAKAAENTEGDRAKGNEARDKARERDRLHNQTQRAQRRAARARAEYEAIKKPCDDAEKALAEAEEALRKAEELLAEKIDESGNRDRPPKKLVEEKKMLDKLRKDLQPQQGTVVPASASQASEVTKSTDGMRVITFDTSAGQIVVNLPDDMRAGDTISGTVVAEPKGSTDQERNKNMAELSGYVVELQTPKPRNDGDKKPTPTIVKWIDKGSPDLFLLNLPDTKTGEKLLDVNLRQLAPGERSKFGAPNYFPLRENETAPGKLIATDLPVHIEYHDNAIWYTGVINDFNIPKIVQQGRPIEIIGPFDGDSSNTTLKSSVQDFEKGTENVSGGFGLIRPLVESPRRAAFRNSTNVTGPIELTLNEANKETKGTYRNVGVKLAAPKTNLLKGESTTLTVKVEGLQGITEDVPLHLENASPTVVRMAGGDKQTFGIKPSTVQPDGTFMTTRAITGQQAGAFTVTATVVVFNICLQDDNSGNSLLLNSRTGDVIFCDSAGGRLYVHIPLTFGEDGKHHTNPVGATVRPGIYKQGAITVADLHYAGGHFALQHDGSNHAGNATVQTTNPKQTFTITDRDTRNNTCTCQ